MKIVLISNYINHYMLPLIEELINLGCDAWFVETDMLPENLRKGGFYDYGERPYFVRAWQDKVSKSKMEQLAIEADVLIIGNKPKMLEWKRLRQDKLTFEISERPLKKGIINAISPVVSKTQLFYHLLFYNKPVYMLCLSSYTAKDEYRLHAFKDRCYQFGYFPRIPVINVEEVLDSKPKGKIRIIWCARFIKWKHPEQVVLLAEKLKGDGYDFEINMIGGGVEYLNIEKLIKEKDVRDCVHLLGNHPNNAVLKMMSEHHIFLFTSDKNEGWGVVLNEAMGQCCCPVAAREIGAVPALLKNDINGKVYAAKSLDSLYNAMKDLLDNPAKIRKMATQAYDTVQQEWNPVNAAKCLYDLFKATLSGKPYTKPEGICSKAYPIE